MDQKSYVIEDVQPCPFTGQVCKAGFELAENLLAPIAAADGCITDDFSISGCMATDICGRRCKIGYVGTRVASRVFGDVRADEDIDALSQGALPAGPRERAHLMIKPATQVLS